MLQSHLATRDGYIDLIFAAYLAFDTIFEMRGGFVRTWFGPRVYRTDNPSFYRWGIRIQWFFVALLAVAGFWKLF